MYILPILLFIALSPHNVISSPVGHPEIRAEKSHQQPRQDQRGTKESPLVVEGNITSKAAEKSPEERKQEEEKIKIERSVATYTGWLAAITILLVIATTVLAIFTYKLWRETRQSSDRQAKEMQESLRIANVSAKAAENSASVAQEALYLTQRAYLSANSYIALPIRNGKREITGWQLGIFWVNSGQTPAKEAHLACSILTGLPVEQFTFAEMPEERSRAVISPRVTIRNLAQRILTQEESRQIARGEFTAYLCGLGEYRDIFKDTPIRKTSICMQIVVADSRLTSPNDFMFNAHHNYNWAD